MLRTEEDLPLFPEVFVFASEAGLKALAPSSGEVTIGFAPLTSESASMIVKSCAPLAKDGWSIFVVNHSAKENRQLRFGLFRSLRHSFATGAEESMGGLGAEMPVILIRNRGHFVVDLRSTTANRFTVALTTTPATISVLEQDVDKFVNAASFSLKDCPTFPPYLRRLLTGILQKCHGTLLGVIAQPTIGKRHGMLKDGIWLEPFISLSQLHARASEARTADALADLQAAEGMLRGMIESDGVVVFGDAGTLLAYRVFLKPKSGEKGKLFEEGGGRRRAFELMKLRLSTPFKAVLFRSQDGETKCEDSK